MDRAVKPANSAYLWGPLTGLGVLVAAVAVAADQASKLWMLFVYDIGARQRVAVTPFLDLVLVWN